MTVTSELPLLEPDLDDFYEAWYWLREHPYFFYADSTSSKRFAAEPGFEDALDIFVARVNPATGRIEDDPTLNTATEVWLEVGPWLPDDDQIWKGLPAHDPSLDCGGPTFEEAIKALARRVMEVKGSYPEYRICSHCLRTVPAGATEQNAEWFCSPGCKACGRTGIVTEPIEGSTNLRYVPPRERFDCEHWNND